MLFEFSGLNISRRKTCNQESISNDVRLQCIAEEESEVIFSPFLHVSISICLI